MYVYLYTIYIFLVALVFPFTGIFNYIIFIILTLLSFTYVIISWRQYHFNFIILLIILPYFIIIIYTISHITFNYGVFAVFLYVLFLIVGGGNWMWVHLFPWVERPLLIFTITTVCFYFITLFVITIIGGG